MSLLNHPTTHRSYEVKVSFVDAVKSKDQAKPEIYTKPKLKVMDAHAKLQCSLPGAFTHCRRSQVLEFVFPSPTRFSLAVGSDLYEQDVQQATSNLHSCYIRSTKFYYNRLLDIVQQR